MKKIKMTVLYDNAETRFYYIDSEEPENNCEEFAEFLYNHWKEKGEYGAFKVTVDDQIIAINMAKVSEVSFSVIEE